MRDSEKSKTNKKRRRVIKRTKETKKLNRERAREVEKKCARKRQKYEGD